jgi:hypothetical protein
MLLSWIDKMSSQYRVSSRAVGSCTANNVDKTPNKLLIELGSASVLLLNRRIKMVVLNWYRWRFTIKSNAKSGTHPVNVRVA